MLKVLLADSLGIGVRRKATLTPAPSLPAGVAQALW
jgi:hypothetical protein